MSVILDAGALIAFERRDRGAVQLLERSFAAGWITHGGIVGQVWRSPRQVALSRLLRAADIRPLDAALGRDAGRLLAVTGTSDVIDAALVALMRDGDTVITSDPHDLSVLVEAAELDVDLRVV